MALLEIARMGDPVLRTAAQSAPVGQPQIKITVAGPQEI
jgi:hypothetical protein